MERNKIIRIVLIGLIFIIGIFVLLKLLSSDKPIEDENLIQIVALDTNSKMQVGDYLVLTNTLYQKALQATKEMNEYISLYEQGSLSINDLNSYIAQYNKKVTYYYLVAVQNPSLEYTQQVEKDLNYEFYLMRRASEELLKFAKDNSTLRLSVGKDLLAQAISKEYVSNQLIAENIARYAIDADNVVISQEVWDKEYTFIQQHPELVVFKDLDSEELQKYAYYLKIVNDNFMLVSWEIQHIYQDKLDYDKGKISAEQLSSNLDKSGYIINRVYEEFSVLKAPEGLENLEEDVKKTMQMYHDAILEIQKFRMGLNTQHYENAMEMIEQADENAARIGEFIYSVRHQYKF